MPEQLSFDLPVRPAMGREDFFVSPANAAALATIESWQRWPQRRLILLGPEGSGKTHLAHVWAALSDARIVGAGDLTPAAVPEIATLPAVVFEDADRGADERALLHLLNLIAAEGGSLLLTAEAPPMRWRCTLPDLQSRLQASAVTALDPPDDALLQAVLVKQFTDRQIRVSPDLIGYAVPRLERSFAAARRFVADLDTTSLAQGRRVTRTMAAGLLDKTGCDNA